MNHRSSKVGTYCYDLLPTGPNLVVPFISLFFQNELISMREIRKFLSLSYLAYFPLFQSLRLVRLGHPARVTNPRLHSICLDAICANSDEGRLAEDVRRELEDLFRNDGGKSGGKAEQRLKGQARTREAKELRLFLEP